MCFCIHFTTGQLDTFPPLVSLRQFEGDSPMDVLQNALKAIPSPVENDGEQFWARVVIDAEEGRAKRALSIPVVREGTVPVDFGMVDGGR